MAAKTLLQLAREAEPRFWPKVDRSGGPDACWLWTAGKIRTGYGCFTLNNDGWTKRFLAHRLSWLLSQGRLPDEVSICHSCDNPPCVNPRHLFEGTHEENMADARRKGRMACGERAGTAKLSEASVVDIRERYAKGETQEEIAADFGVSRRSVGSIVSGRLWRTAPGPRLSAADRKSRVGLPGGRNHFSRIKESDVYAIRRALNSGLRYRDIADRFGISKAHVYNIASGKSWSHLLDDGGV